MPTPLPIPEYNRNQIINCTNCRLNQAPYKPGLPTQTIGTNKPIALFLAEAPGANEAIDGIPLVGKAGTKVFQPMLERLGIGLEDIAVGNVAKHRPPDNRNPKDDELIACSKHLLKEITLLQPKIIICLGKLPTRALYLIMNQKPPKYSLHGQKFTFSHPHGCSYPVYVTHHPAYISYNGGLDQRIGEEFISEIETALKEAYRI